MGNGLNEFGENLIGTYVRLPCKIIRRAKSFLEKQGGGSINGQRKEKPAYGQSLYD